MVLIIGLPHVPQTESFDHVLSADGVHVLRQGTASAPELPQADQLVAILPASRLTWYSVKLPAVSKSQRMAAVIGLLEDQWLQAPDSLHISLHMRADADADADQDNGLVCVCDAQWLRDALQPLVQAGRMPQRLVPEFAPVMPTQTETLHVWGTAQQPLLAWCRPTGVLWSPLPCPWPLLQATPVRAHAEPALLALAQSQAGLAADDVRTQTRAERWLAATGLPWDLAQGEWSQTRSQKLWRQTLALGLALWHEPAWKTARWALSALLLTQALGLLIWAWLIDQELTHQQQALGQMLRQTFAQTQVIIDPAAQMHQALQRLRQQVGAEHPGQLEVMLQQLNTQLPPQTHIESLSYDGKVLKIQGSGPFQLGEASQSRLRQLGYQVQSHPQGISLSYEGAP
jgi:general secretion pathway protein L